MKKLLNLLAIATLLVSNTSIAVACKPNKNVNEGEDKKVQRQGSTMKVDGDFYTGLKNQKERAIQSASGQPFKSHYITKNGQYDHMYNPKLGFDQNLLSWNAGFDRDAKYNVATQSIAKREVDRHPSNPENQDVTGKVKNHSMGATDKNWDATPSQEFQGQVWGQSFQNWQYVDTWVSWAGGQIGAPSAPLINLAHKNGTKIFGLIWMAHFHEQTWENNAELFLQGPEGNYLSADKLIEIALEYGFDGYMVNQEGGHKVDHQSMLNWMAYYNQKAKEVFQETGREIMFTSYINSQPVYSISGLGADMFRNSNIYYNDFRSDIVKSYNWIKENEYGREFDAPTLVNVEGNSGKKTPLNVSEVDWIEWTNISKSKKIEHGASISMFGGSDTGNEFNVQDAKNWSKDIPDFKGNDFLNTLQLMHEYDGRLYSGSVDKTETRYKWYESNPQKNRKKSASAVIAERTTVINNSFKTNFSTGNGIGVYKQGKNLRPEFEWNNRGVSDVTPTYKWIVNNKGDYNKEEYKPQINFDYSDAWEKSNSIALTGEWDFDKSKFKGTSFKTNGLTEAELYASNIDEKGQDIELIFKAGELDNELNVKNDIANNLNVQLKLGYEIASSKIVENSLYPEMKSITSTLVAEKLNDSNWYKIKAPLKDVIGQGNKLVKIGVSVKAKGDQNNIKVNLGELLINNKDQIDELNAVKNLEVEYAIKDKKNNKTAKDNNYNLRIHWKREKEIIKPNQEQNFDYNEIYQIDKDGKYIFLGATRDNAFFLENIAFNGSEVKIAIKSIHLFNKEKTKETIQTFKLL